MKIRATVTVEIDAEAWAANNGIDVEDVREDVKAYIAASVKELAAVEEARP
jgi:hypothetical protein